MQELQPITGLAGRLFGSAGAADPAATGLVRHRSGPATAGSAEMRCPRCDSANTKFCYYNNHNLAQPRHFCRACRRYWTKGGLLRNVPVGGRCRKPKPKRPADAGKNDAGAHRDAKNPRSGGASDSSSTAAADAPATSSASPVATQPSGPSCSSRSVVETRAGTGLFAAGDTLTQPLPPPAPMFADQAVAFASFLAPPPLPTFSFSAQLPKPEERVAPHVLAQQPAPASTAHATPFAVLSDGCLTAGASGWPPSASDAGIFELTGGIAGDTLLPAYWNPGSWTDTDPSIYLP